MTISIIIPTLNEALFIEKTIQTIKAAAYDASTIEIIVVDAGSTDQTATKAQPLVDQMAIHPEFVGAKYLSLNQGALLAKGDVLLFLDADCKLPHHYDQLIKDVLGSGAVGGAFEFKMKDPRWDFKILELLNRMRYRIDQMYFGDQALFCSKSAFHQIDGYPDEPIMESAFLCRALLRKGTLKLIHTPVISSTRRFDNQPYKVFALDFWIWILFTFRFEIRSYANDYWKENIRRGG